MTSRDDLVDLITSTAVAALDWHWDARPPYVLSPEDVFRHVAEAIADALPLAEAWDDGYREGAFGPDPEEAGDENPWRRRTS